MHVLQKIGVVLAIISFCRGVQPLTFRGCRAADPLEKLGQLFTIECLDGQVIEILSAEVGYSALYNPNASIPECPWNNCTNSTDFPANACNGRGLRICEISQDPLIHLQNFPLCDLNKDGNFIIIEYACTARTTGGVKTTEYTTTDNNGTFNVSTPTGTVSPCSECGELTTMLNISSHREELSLSTGVIAGIAVGSAILCLLLIGLLVFCCVRQHRREANKSTSNGSVTKTTTTKSKKDNKNQSPPATYEMACEVNDEVPTLDTNGRLVSVRQARSTHEPANGLPTNCSNGETSTSGYSTVNPVPLPQKDSRTQPPIYSQVNKKRATRTAQQGGYETIADDFCEKDGEVGKEHGDGVAEEDGIVCDSIKDITLVDNPIYAGTTVPASATSSPPPPPAAAAAAAAGPVTDAANPYEEINISNTDITLIDNAIYNK